MTRTIAVRASVVIGITLVMLYGTACERGDVSQSVSGTDAVPATATALETASSAAGVATQVVPPIVSTETPKPVPTVLSIPAPTATVTTLADTPDSTPSPVPVPTATAVATVTATVEAPIDALPTPAPATPIPTTGPEPTVAPSPEPTSEPILTPTLTPDTATIWDRDIEQDTTWSLVNSPYVITTHVTIASDATLEIEPGVIVLFRPSVAAQGSGVSLEVTGTLSAIGTPDANVRFALDPTISLNLSDPLNQHQGVFTSDGGQIYLDWCDYGGGNGIRLASMSGPVSISNCELHDIPDSAISGGQSTEAISTIEDNYIHHAGTGVSLRAPGVIQRNCITDNRWGVVPGKNWGLTSTFKDNSIFDSTDLEIVAEASIGSAGSVIDLSGNFWGGLTAGEVDFRTLDFDDEPDRDRVLVEPIRTSDAACGRWG